MNPAQVAAAWEAIGASTAIWHSVSCACDVCLRMDDFYISHGGVTLDYDNRRPLFAKEP